MPHQDFLGQDGDLTDFELELISGGQARPEPILNQGQSMTDFQSFRNAVLEDDDLQEAVISIINTATANGSGWEMA